MSATQELLDLLKDARPSAHMERKALRPKAAKPPIVPMYRALTPGRVELPALGGSCSLVYDDTPFARRIPGVEP